MFFFKVYNELGSGLHEKYYQRAVAKNFSLEKINFRQQVPVEIKF